MSTTSLTIPVGSSASFSATTSTAVGGAFSIPMTPPTGCTTSDSGNVLQIALGGTSATVTVYAPQYATSGTLTWGSSSCSDYTFNGITASTIAVVVQQCAPGCLICASLSACATNGCAAGTYYSSGSCTGFRCMCSSSMSLQHARPVSGPTLGLLPVLVCIAVFRVAICFWQFAKTTALPAPARAPVLHLAVMLAITITRAPALVRSKSGVLIWLLHCRMPTFNVLGKRFLFLYELSHRRMVGPRIYVCFELRQYGLDLPRL